MVGTGGWEARWLRIMHAKHFLVIRSLARGQSPSYKGLTEGLTFLPPGHIRQREQRPGLCGLLREAQTSKPNIALIPHSAGGRAPLEETRKPSGRRNDAM